MNLNNSIEIFNNESVHKGLKQLQTVKLLTFSIPGKNIETLGIWCKVCTSTVEVPENIATENTFVFCILSFAFCVHQIR